MILAMLDIIIGAGVVGIGVFWTAACLAYRHEGGERQQDRQGLLAATVMIVVGLFTIAAGVWRFTL